MGTANKLIDAKSAEAKHLRLDGMTQKDIAESMGCSVLSVWRYLQHDAEGKPEEELATMEPGHLEEILAVGLPLLLSLLKDIEGMRDRGELKPRDTIIAYGVVSDKLGRVMRSTKKEDANEVNILKAKLIIAQYNEAVALHALEQVRKGDMRYLEDVGVQEAIPATVEVIEDGEIMEEANTGVTE